MAISTPRLDTLTEGVRDGADSLTLLRRKLEKLQSFSTSNITDTISKPLDASQDVALKLKLQSRIDSLEKLKLPSDKYKRKLDSLNSYNPNKGISKSQAAIVGAQTDLNNKLAKPFDRANVAIGGLNDEAEGFGNLPTDVKMPPATNKLPTADLGAMPPIPSTGLNSLDVGPKISPGLNLNIQSNIGSVGADADIENSLDQISQRSADIADYADDAKSISSGNLAEVKQLNEDAVLQIGGDNIDQAQAELTKGSTVIKDLGALNNQDEFKKHAIEKGREQVVQQIALYEPGIVQTVNKVSQHQRRLGTLFSRVKGLPRRPLKEKKPPFLERFVPALTFQVQRSTLWSLDLNPSIHYRLMSILSVGAGWNERLVFDNDMSLHKSMRIFGPRSFAQLSVLKGLSIRLEVEYMKTLIQSAQADYDRVAVLTYAAGLKKDFSVSSMATGNVQFLYYLYDPNGHLPYQNRFNVRFGFDFGFRSRGERARTK